MNKTASFVRLDFLTLKPYYKTYLIFIAIAAVITYATKSTISMVFYIMVAMSMTVSYPFSIGEKNGLDTLYATLSLRKKSVVIGRYAFAAILELLGVLLILALSAASSILIGFEFSAPEMLMCLCLASLYFSFMAAVQYPVYFRIGYDKAKYIAYVPLALIFLLSLLIGDAAPFIRLIDTHPLMLCAASALAGIALLLVSCGISIKAYAKRDI